MSTLNEHDIDRIQDYIDGELPDEEMREVADRLNRDPEWRAEEERMRALLRRVQAMPKAIDPGRDLWHGIERRITEAPAENVITLSRRAVYAYAAAAALVVFASVAFAILNRPAPETGTVARGEDSIERPGDTVNPSPSANPDVQFVSLDEHDAEYELALAQYKSATDALRTSIEERSGSMEEETWTAVSESLAVIEQAIQDIETALEADPANEELRNMLVAAYQKEVGLLRQAVLL